MCRGEEKRNGSVEWTINVAGEGPTKLVAQTSNLHERAWSWVGGVLERIRSFLQSCWRIGVNEPKKFMHSLKVSAALCVVSLFYYMRPLYDSFGGNAMWAIMTVVVVFEYTVGATLYKCINRTIATVVGGSLGFGVNWIASQSGEKFEPIILGASVFIFAGSATFFRFIPKVKARCDYGANIFILTFSLVSVSGYRVDKLFPLAYERVSTIMVGTCLCILISMLVYPAWAGDQLHTNIIQNLDKLATSVQACVDDYFNSPEANSKTCKEDDTKKRLAYKCVLNSTAAQDAMANFAIWEPAHGKFSFGHPWKSYQKIGAAARNLACCIDSLNICINSGVEVPEVLRKMVEEECLKVSSYASQVLRELGSMIRETKKSSKIEMLVADLNFAVQELHNALKCLPRKLSSGDCGVGGEKGASLLEILPLAAMVSFLTEAVSRIEDIVDQVNGLAKLAKFNPKNEAAKSEDKESAVDDDEQSLDNQQQPTKAAH
ncbi:hypothetical protein V2J09_024331 [Rumex salicifolius]